MRTDRQAEALLNAEQLNLRPITPNLNRIDRALDLLDASAVLPTPTSKVLPGMRLFNVQSQTDPDVTYTVEIYDQFRSTCTCPDVSIHCKHVIAVRIQELRDIESAWEHFHMDDEQVTHQWLGIFAQP